MNPKKIGNNFERKFCKLLSEWITKERNSLICWRQAHSGSISSIRKKKGLSPAEEGDIHCIDPQYQRFFDKIYFDTKSHKNINFHSFFKNSISDIIIKDWIKVIKECSNSKIPLMPVEIRDKKTPLLLFLDKTGYLLFNLNNIELECFFHYKKDNIEFYIISLFEFFKKITYQNF